MTDNFDFSSLLPTALKVLKNLTNRVKSRASAAGHKISSALGRITHSNSIVDRNTGENVTLSRGSRGNGAKSNRNQPSRGQLMADLARLLQKMGGRNL